MSEQASASEPVEVLRWYTSALRIPRLIGKLTSGERIWGGPYTVTQAVVGGDLGALVEGGVDEDAVPHRRGAGQGHRRTVVERLGARPGCLGRQDVGGVAQQRDLGQEDDLGAGLGGLTDRLVEHRGELVGVLSPAVLDEGDAKGRLRGVVDAGQAGRGSVGCDEAHSRTLASGGDRPGRP